MATRSRIGILRKDKTILSIYCHNNGYPESVGALLKRHYCREKRVQRLLELGDLSHLGKNIGSKIDFNDRATRIKSKQCVAYRRDGGDAETDPILTTSYVEYSHIEEYNYLFVPGEGWKLVVDGNIQDY